MQKLIMREMVISMAFCDNTYYDMALCMLLNIIK